MSANDVSALYADRRKTRDPVIAIYNEVEQGIRGIHPKRFDNLWSESDVKLQIRTLRLADDGLTKFLSEIPVFPHVKTLGKRNSDKARKAAELVEKVAHSYNDGSAARGGVEFDGIRLQLARHQVRFGDGCLVIHPDYERKLVYFEVFDDPYLTIAREKQIKGWTREKKLALIRTQNSAMKDLAPQLFGWRPAQFSVPRRRSE